MKKLQTMLFLSFFFLCLTKGQAGIPLWTFTVPPGSQTTQVVPSNSTATVQYIVHNQSNKIKNLVVAPAPWITQLTPCPLAPKGQSGSTCLLNLAINGQALPAEGIHRGPILCQANSNGTSNPNQCYQPSLANVLQLTKGTSTEAVISVNPTTLNMAVNSSNVLTITNQTSSLKPANNITASIPAGSGITVQSTTCGASLAIGASCTITLSSNDSEGPIVISVAGVNTNTVKVIVTVSRLPILSISSPVQQNRIIPVSAGFLNLVISNSASSSFNALGVTVSNHSDCPNISVNDSNCTSIAPGSSCTLILSSSVPYAPCNLTITGTNDTNTLTTLVAFSYLEGLVFAYDAMTGDGKVVIDAANELTRNWLPNFAPPIAGALSLDDGTTNTDEIVATTSCTNVSNLCAAYKCREFAPYWYLPAINELSALYNSLCSNHSYPCNFGGFIDDTNPPLAAFFSSTQIAAFSGQIDVIKFATNSYFTVPQNIFNYIRCIRKFP